MSNRKEQGSLMIFDDLENDKDAKSPDYKKKVDEWFFKVFKKQDRFSPVAR